VPKKSDEFVKILDLQQFAKRQKKIAADNLNAMRVDQSSDLKRPYFNPGVVGLVNKSNNSYITSLLQVLLGQPWIKQYYIDQGNYWLKLNPKYQTESGSQVLKFLSDVFKHVFMVECHPLEQYAIHMSFNKMQLL